MEFVDPRTEVRAGSSLGGFIGALARVTSLRTCGTFASKESAMWNWLVRFWHSLMGSKRSKFGHTPYHRTNLHGRH